MFNPLSGDTHIFDIVTGEALKNVMVGPVSTSHIRKQIADFLNLPNDVAMAKNLGDILALLDELGLIERVSGC